MPKETFTSLLDWLHKYSPAMALAAFGSLVAALNDHRSEWSWTEFLVGLLTAAFVGFLVCAALEPFKLPESSKAVTISISGYLSGHVLQLFVAKIKKYIEVLLK